MLRLVPVLAVNGERLVVIALEKQGVGEVLLDEDQIVAVRFLDPVADLVGQRLGLFAIGLSIREPVTRQIVGLIGHYVPKQFYRFTLRFQALLSFQLIAQGPKRDAQIVLVLGLARLAYGALPASRSPGSMPS